ncbi:MAG: hypothetical protein NXI10_14745 [bacterium]|nr:hypothetical protein [bacterium]
MGIGGIIIESMKRTMKENDALRPSKRKTPNDSKEGRLSRNVHFEKREFTQEQLLEHQARLKKNKRSDQIRMIILFAIIAGVIGVIAIYG